jgi:outer membrane protein with beta-barrel domain
MKKFILATVAIIALVTISQAQFKLGIKAGANYSEQRVNVSHGTGLFSNDHLKTFHAGLIGEMPIADRFYLQPQLLYTRKGSTLLSTSGAPDTKLRIDYIEVPINVVYKIPVSFGKVFAGTGATIGYGFGGKEIQGREKRAVYSDLNTWKHEDLSLNFTAGLEFNNGLFLSVNSQKSFLNTSKVDGVSVKNRSVSVSVGYLIDWKTTRKKS